MALPSSRQDREYKKFVENAAGDVALRVVATDAAGADLSAVDDSAFTPGTSTVIASGYMADETTTDSVNEGDVGVARMTLDRRTISAANYLEDSEHVSGGYGTQMLGVRNDVLASLAGTDGDYAPLQVDASGALYVALASGSSQYAEDAAHTSGEVGSFMLGIRTDTFGTAGNIGGADGDYMGLQLNAKGGLYADLSSVLGADMSVTNGAFVNITDNTTGVDVLPLTAAVTSTGALSVAGEIVDFDTAAGEDFTPVLGILGASSGGAKALYLVSDDAAMDATPTILPIGGEYRSVDTTYTDRDATILQTTIAGHLKVRTDGYDTATDSQKVFDVAPLNTQYNNAVINVDTTNVAAAATYYPSSIGFTMNGQKNFSLTGKFIDAHAVTSTLSVQGTNDEDPATADWLDIQGQINGLASATAAIPTVTGTVAGVTGVTVVPGTVCNLLTTAVAQTVKFAWDFDNLNYRYVRVVLTPGDATNTVILKGRTTY